MGGMTDDAMMRFRLQKVAAYRGLCRAVRRTGRHNVLWAGLMMFLSYLTFQAAAVGPFSYVYLGLAVAELMVGLYKLVSPSAEGLLFDAVVLTLFAASSLGRQALLIAAGAKPSGWIIFGLFLLWQAVGQFKQYAAVRKLFADRPTPDQIAWFDDLVAEIRAADPRDDDQALDLRSKPRWKAKLLGPTVFLVAPRADDVVVVGADGFALEPVRADADGDDPPTVRVVIYDSASKPFEVDEASWSNYRKWAAERARERATGPTDTP